MKRLYFLIVILAFAGSCGPRCEDNQVSNGIQKEYYASGELLAETSMQNCLCEGIYRSFYKNGRIFIDGKCSEGMRTGICNIKTSDGSDFGAAVFRNDSLLSGEYRFLNGTKFNLDAANNLLHNSQGDSLIHNAVRMFSSSVNIKYVSADLIAISDYRRLIVLSDSLSVVFDSQQVTSNDFIVAYSSRRLNFEGPQCILVGGMDCWLEGLMLIVQIQYMDTETGKARDSKFSFTLPLPTKE